MSKKTKLFCFVYYAIFFAADMLMAVAMSVQLPIYWSIAFVAATMLAAYFLRPAESIVKYWRKPLFYIIDILFTAAALTILNYFMPAILSEQVERLKQAAMLISLFMLFFPAAKLYADRLAERIFGGGHKF